MLRYVDVRNGAYGCDVLGVPVIAVEGASDSGKSTLAQALARLEEWRPALVMPCYADLLTPESMPPPIGEDVDEQLHTLRFYQQLDHQRRTAIAEADPRPRLVVIDRSWLSLVAHTYAVEHTGGPPAYAAARRLLVEDAEKVVPHLVLALQADLKTRRDRMAPDDQSRWFTDEAFNLCLDRFFAEEAPQFADCVCQIGAGLDASMVVEAAVHAIRNSGLMP